MDPHIYEYFKADAGKKKGKAFHDVLQLDPSISKEKIQGILPPNCMGWYELSQLSTNDRKEFLEAFWISKLPFHPRLESFLDKFFGRIQEIYVFLIKRKPKDSYEAYLFYSLKDGGGFYKGQCGATETNILDLKAQFPSVNFPNDYLGFLQIHNGFAKFTDTGILPTGKVYDSFITFQELILSKDSVLSFNDQPIDPRSLIPFYESFGMPFYQCFFADWYPEYELGHEMGNVYYSGVTNTISNIASKDLSVENMAFKTFSDWLMFYLESIEE